MKVTSTPAAMQRWARRWRTEGRRIGFVPTMGYLHDGHVSLMHEARRRVGPDGIVVVSIYVNPTQFAPTEDLARYPRDWAGDRRRCREAGVAMIYAPTDAAMYPGRAEGRYSTYVVEDALGQRMEGRRAPPTSGVSRPSWPSFSTRSCRTSRCLEPRTGSRRPSSGA